MSKNYSIIISEREIRVNVRGNFNKFVAKVIEVKSPFFLAPYGALSGCSSVWLERALRERQVVRSSRTTRTSRDTSATSLF